jgi:hypothetical protein
MQAHEIAATPPHRNVATNMKKQTTKARRPIVAKAAKRRTKTTPRPASIAARTASRFSDLRLYPTEPGKKKIRAVRMRVSAQEKTIVWD